MFIYANFTMYSFPDVEELVGEFLVIGTVAKGLRTAACP